MNIKDLFADNHLVIQQGQSNCGPATLLNVLRLKGDFSHTEEELAQLCDAKVGYGTTPENLVKAAQRLGLELFEEKSNASLEDIKTCQISGVTCPIDYLEHGAALPPRKDGVTTINH